MVWCMVFRDRSRHANTSNCSLFEITTSHYNTLGIFLCFLRICSCSVVLWLVMYGQYGHWQWGFFPHSNLKCLKRFVLHVYTFPHLEQGWGERDHADWHFTFGPLLIPKVAAPTSWIIWLPSKYAGITSYVGNSTKWKHRFINYGEQNEDTKTSWCHYKNMAINYIKPYGIYTYFIKLVSAILWEIWWRGTEKFIRFRTWISGGLLWLW